MHPSNKNAQVQKTAYFTKTQILENSTHTNKGKFTKMWQNNNKTHVSPKQRSIVLKRDHHTCQHCGHHDTTGKTLQIDHINNTRGNGYNKIANLQTLCTTCHNTKTQQEAAAGRQKRRNRAQYPKEAHPGLKTPAHRI